MYTCVNLHVSFAMVILTSWLLWAETWCLTLRCVLFLWSKSAKSFWVCIIDNQELNRENIQICSLEELIPLIQERRNARLDVYQGHWLVAEVSRVIFEMFWFATFWFKPGNATFFLGLLHWFAQHAEEMFMPNDESLQIRTSDLEVYSATKLLSDF